MKLRKLNIVSGSTTAVWLSNALNHEPTRIDSSNNEDSTKQSLYNWTIWQNYHLKHWQVSPYNPWPDVSKRWNMTSWVTHCTSKHCTIVILHLKLNWAASSVQLTPSPACLLESADTSVSCPVIGQFFETLHSHWMTRH